MWFYRVPKGTETNDRKWGKCDNTECVDHDRTQVGATAVRRFGWLIKVEMWKWECPTCEGKQTCVWFRVA